MHMHPVEDPTGSHSSGKNIIVRQCTIPVKVYQDAEEDVTDARVERSPHFSG